MILPEAQVATDGLAIGGKIDAARQAQRLWATLPLASRLRCIRNVRHLIAERSTQLAETVHFAGRSSSAETLAAEIIPLAESCRFLERKAARVLAVVRPSRRDRPIWLNGVRLRIEREPWGAVLIISASNYPLLIPGVQTLQAVTAGNAVVLKPGQDGTAAAVALRELCVDAGIDPDLVVLLSESTESAIAAIESGVDRVVLTGSAETGRAVLRRLAERLTPSTMELSGCDAAFVLDSADLDRAAQSLAFGLDFNSSGTCIAPRRVFVSRSRVEELATRLCGQQRHRHQPPPSAVCGPYAQSAAALVEAARRQGARVLSGGVCREGSSLVLEGKTILADMTPDMKLLQSDVLAPVLMLIPVDSIDEALSLDASCPYALGATIFGHPREANDLASRIDAGCVVVNDMIVPTADPRVPFGGRKQSGFGVTRGAAGLQEMTHVKTIIHQTSRWLPHLESPSPHDGELFSSFLSAWHGRGWNRRWRGLRRAMSAVVAQRKWRSQRGRH